MWKAKVLTLESGLLTDEIFTQAGQRRHHFTGSPPVIRDTVGAHAWFTYPKHLVKFFPCGDNMPVSIYEGCSLTQTITK